ncbi:MAG: HNH endonuclease [Ilumatobacteraceae bacterium]
MPRHNDAEACELARSATVAQLRVGLGKHFLVHPEPASAAPSAGGSAGPSLDPDTDPDTDPNVDVNADPDTDPDTDPNADVGSNDPSRSAQPAPTPAAAPPPAPECERRLAVGFDDDGDFFLHGLTDGLDGALIQQSLAEAKDALFADGHTAVTWMDALVEVCRRSLAGVASPSRRDLYSVVVHLDSEGAWIHNGPPLPSALLEQITCDGSVRPLWSTAGLPVDLGRTQHVVPRRTRIVVEDRDRVCRHPTCTSNTHLQIHHITHWTKGGATDTNNLACLCSRHHHAHHRGEFTITGNADDVHDGGDGVDSGDGGGGGGGLTFHDARGNVIRSCGVPNPPGERPPPQPTSPYAHPTGERLELRWLSFTPPPDADEPDVHHQN